MRRQSISILSDDVPTDDGEEGEAGEEMLPDALRVTLEEEGREEPVRKEKKNILNKKNFILKFLYRI